MNDEIPVNIPPELQHYSRQIRVLGTREKQLRFLIERRDFGAENSLTQSIQERVYSRHEANKYAKTGRKIFRRKIRRFGIGYNYFPAILSSCQRCQTTNNRMR